MIGAGSGTILRAVRRRRISSRRTHRLETGATQGAEMPGSLDAMVADADDYVDKQRIGHVLRWRRLSGLGGLFLAVSFFLPAVDGCSTPFVPATEVWEFVRDRSGSVADWPGVFSTAIAAYLLGLLALILGLCRFVPRFRFERAIGVANAVVLGVVIATYLVSMAVEYPPWEWIAVVYVGLGLFSLIYWLRCVRMGPAGLMSLRWYGPILCMIWFSHFLVTGTTYYGLWLSILGSTVMMVGTTGEAKARSRLPLGRTFRKLLFACRWLIDVDDAGCRSCGYLLIGLTIPRCPECGVEFAWSDYAVELQLSSAADPNFESTTGA